MGAARVQIGGRLGAAPTLKRRLGAPGRRSGERWTGPPQNMRHSRSDATIAKRCAARGAHTKAGPLHVPSSLSRMSAGRKGAGKHALAAASCGAPVRSDPPAPQPVSPPSGRAVSARCHLRAGPAHGGHAPSLGRAVGTRGGGAHSLVPAPLGRGSPQFRQEGRPTEVPDVDADPPAHAEISDLLVRSGCRTFRCAQPSTSSIARALSCATTSARNHRGAQRGQRVPLLAMMAERGLPMPARRGRQRQRCSLR